MDKEDPSFDLSPKNKKVPKAGPRPPIKKKRVLVDGYWKEVQ